MRKTNNRFIPSRTSPKGSSRACLCWDSNTYSISCCDGSMRAQGIGVITRTLFEPEIEGRPTIAGISEVGNIFTATPAPVTPIPTVRTWQWQYSANGLTGWLDIAGATNDTYLLVIGDTDKYIRAQQIETNIVGVDTADSLASNQIINLSQVLVAALKARMDSFENETCTLADLNALEILQID